MSMHEREHEREHDYACMFHILGTMHLVSSKSAPGSPASGTMHMYLRTWLLARTPALEAGCQGLRFCSVAVNHGLPPSIDEVECSESLPMSHGS